VQLLAYLIVYVACVLMRQEVEELKPFLSARTSKTIILVTWCLKVSALIFLFSVLFSLGWNIYWYFGDYVREQITQHGRPYSIYLKGRESPIKGKLLLQSSRYLLLIGNQETSMIAIPQTEVLLIEAQWPFPAASPVAPPIATPPTPSQQSPTPM
jgi:hypothetical protein